VPLVGLLAAVLALPSVAQATLAFVRMPLSLHTPFHPMVWVAEDDGSHARKLVSGTSPHVSPDGNLIAFNPFDPAKGYAFESNLFIGPADGSAPVTKLMGNWRETSMLRWSPDSSTIAALRGPELGKRTLVLVDVATGAQNAVATGYFSGFSFAPQGGQLVYARAGSEKFPLRSDVFRFEIPIGQPVRYIPPVRITNDHRSAYPLWGPNGTIVFVKLLGAKTRKYGPKNELFLMNEAGGKVRRLTHTKVDPLLQGLYPTAWSANGRRLLAEFEGQDTTYAATVNPRTGAQRPLVKATEQGFLGWALSADGKLVLGSTSGFEPGPGNDVASIPYTGGKPKILAKNAFEPSWSR
jgi:dipeptidyl aminopeptidase/acylaminoacyl peptidase